MSMDNILLDIVSCEEKVILKRKPSPRDIYIAKMGHKVLQCLKQMRESACKCIEVADNPELMAIGDFIGLDIVMCKTFHVVTGELITFSVKQWLQEGMYRTLN
jgi:hypothetical protein